jgi:predicted acylesterase/phospholipase RssA/CRP-like cAMP-binding protein
MENNNNIVHFIKSSHLFSALSDQECSEIIPFFKPLKIKQHDILFKQGDPSDYLYILIEGHLLAMLSMSNNDNEVVGAIENGEVIGELGILSLLPRTLTIKATTDSTLIKISAEDFTQIYEKKPSVLHAIIHPLIQRSQKTLRLLSQKGMNKHIVILPGNKLFSLEKFKDRLKEISAHIADIIFFMDSDPALNVQSVSSQIEALRDKRCTIVYLIESNTSALLQIIPPKPDRIYIIADGNLSPNDEFAKQLFREKPLFNSTKKTLILLSDNNIRLPISKEQWSNYYACEFSLAVRLEQDKDYQRLLRFVTGKTYGLVLGGGGFRGYTHLGVIKALQEANIPIDMIGGTSIGSIAAGCYALSENADDSIILFRKIIDTMRKFSFRNLTWPAVSLFNAKKITEILMDVFGQTKIEELRTGFFCMTCNLNVNNSVSHHEGYIWEKIRGSIALPPFFPPMVMDGQLHVDGSILNDLPVDVMREVLGPDSKIIAVSIFAEKETQKIYNFPPILTFRQVLLAKLGWKYKNYKFPAFLDMYFKCALLGSYSKALQCGKDADLLIFPDLAEYSLLTGPNKKKEEELINIGYTRTLALLNNWEKEPTY